MDEQNIYANIEQPSRPHLGVKSSENIYQDEDACCFVEANRTGPALSAFEESSTVRSCSYRASTVILGLLCLLLLVGLITVFVLSSPQSSLAVERDDLRKKLDDFIYYSQHEWVYFSGSFYYISSITKTWQQSREDCLQKKADLIISNSKEEQNFFIKFSKAMWIGLTDRETEGVWKWVDGTLLTTSVSFWGPDEPNSYGGEEDCAVTGFHKGEKSWNDGACETENFWICEKTMAL